jgi:hypothetical protein
MTIFTRSGLSSSGGGKHLVAHFPEHFLPHLDNHVFIVDQKDGAHSLYEILRDRIRFRDLLFR